MNVRIFSARGSFLSWKLDVAALEREMSAWFVANPGIHVDEIRHDVVNAFGVPPQLIVSIYFR